VNRWAGGRGVWIRTYGVLSKSSATCSRVGALWLCDVSRTALADLVSTPHPAALALLAPSLQVIRLIASPFHCDTCGMRFEHPVCCRCANGPVSRRYSELTRVWGAANKLLSPARASVAAVVTHASFWYRQRMEDDGRRRQIEILGAMSPSQRWDLAERLYRSAWVLKQAYFRASHPDWSEQRIVEETRRAFLHART